MNKAITNRAGLVNEEDITFMTKEVVKNEKRRETYTQFLLTISTTKVQSKFKLKNLITS